MYPRVWCCDVIVSMVWCKVSSEAVVRPQTPVSSHQSVANVPTSSLSVVAPLRAWNIGNNQIEENNEINGSEN